MAMGRPLKLTEEAATRALEVVKVGGTRAQAAARAGVDYSTLERWLARGNRRDGDEPYSTFAREVARAESDAQLLLVSTVTRVVMGGAVLSRETTIRPDGTRHISETFQAPDGRLALEVLARRWPRDWGRLERVEINIRDRAQELADELGLSVDIVMAEAWRQALGPGAKALGSGR